MKLEKEAQQNDVIWKVVWFALCWMTFAARGLVYAQGGADEAVAIQTVLQQAKEAAAGIPENCNLLRRIAIAQAKTGDVEGAIQTAAGIRDDQCSRSAFEQVNSVLGDVQSALGVVAGVRDDRARTYALLAIAKSQEKAGRVQVAKQAAEGIPDGTEWKAMALAKVARAQAKTGDRAGAMQTLDQALQAAARIREDKLRASALEEIATAQADAGDIMGALKTVKLIPKARKDHDVLYSRLVRQLANVGNVKGALDIAAEVGNASLDDSAWQDIAKAQVKAGEIQGALLSADNIRGETEKVEALREIGAAQAKAGDRAGAAKTFEQAVQTATRIQETDDRWNSLSEIAGAQAESGDHRGAMQIADTLLDESARDQALSTIAGAQVRGGDIEGALHTAAGARGKFVKTNVQWAIAKAQLKAGNAQGAMETVASFPSNMNIAGFFCSTGGALARAGDYAGAAMMVEQVLQTAATIQAGPEKADFLIAGLSPIWGAQAGMKDRASAARTLEQASQAVASIRLDIPGRASALGVIARDQAGRSVRDYVGAAKTIEQALRTVDLIRESFENKERVLTNIAVAQAAAGDIRGATQTAAGIRWEIYKVEVLKAIWQAQVKSGDLPAAYALATIQSSPSVKANMLLDVAEGMLERGDAEKSQTASTKP